MRLGNRKILGISNKSTRRAAWVLFFGFVVILLTAGSAYCLYALRPGVTALAKSRAKEIATITVNRAVTEKLKEENIQVSDIMDFTYSEDGKITSASGNVARISQLKSDLALIVTEAIKSISESQLSVPLGSLSGVDILYGTGPRVPLTIAPYGYATADIRTNFSHEGINQTLFEVEAEVTADVSVFMPAIRASEKICASVPVISAIIVGDVPESYTNVERHGEEYEDDVLELLE